MYQLCADVMVLRRGAEDYSDLFPGRSRLFPRLEKSRFSVYNITTSLTGCIL